MNKELIIEHYLSQLDRELQALPTGQRAEIITEIRSHIFESSEKNPAKNVQTLLDDMGTPQTVAMRYLQQKGVKYWAPNRARNWLRIFALSVAGMFAFAVISTMFAIWYFSPLIKVDEAKGRVTLFGGLIDVNEATEEVKVGGMTVKDDSGGSMGGDEADLNMFNINLGGKGFVMSGEEDLGQKSIKLLKIPFNTAKLDVLVSNSAKFKWDCKGAMSGPPAVTVSAGIMTFDLNKLNMAKCELHIPASLKTELTGINGALDVEPRSDMNIKVTNGKVNIKPYASKVYDFEINVINGMHDNFPRSDDKKAVRVKVDLVNGVVKKDE